ncbi:MAG: leucine-rich repeat domain-containing protein, partial [Candidatus Saccharibacteria bacterium]|nr:leucine-rich repeat domain-containing protein [Candidatus Saccharibacteria bacterium]
GTSYTVPDTVKYLDVDFAVTEIGKEAFALRSSLESITLPAGLTTIGKDAFSECSSLQSITIPESVTTIGVGAFYECTSLESITLPAGLTTIENEVFNNCEKLQSIIIPADVTTIGEIAFAGSGLQTITIPAGVISLGMGAFAECAGLTSVTFLGNACQGAIGELAFYEVGKDAPALLTLHGTWAKENQPDEDGNWYGGKFELSEDPTGLIKVDNAQCTMHDGKFFRNGQLIIDANGKRYNAVGF